MYHWQLFHTMYSVGGHGICCYKITSDLAIRFDGHLYDFGDPMLWYTSVFSFNSGGQDSKRRRGKFANTEIYS